MPLLKRIAAEAEAAGALTRGTSRENLHLSADFHAAMAELYEGTRLGRQELDGELLAEADKSLWPRSLIESTRGPAPARDMLARVVVGVDPPASAGGDACGIVVAGKARDGVYHVLDDQSVRGLRPNGWAQAVVGTAERWLADRVVAEGNNGGDMVESVLRGAQPNLPVRMVSATRGKTARAEPVAALFERREARFAGTFPALEDELAGFSIGGGYEGPGRSPDRADAMVWAMTELTRERAAPRILLL
jgi:phage terminase large subunit-like protein